MRNEVEVKHDIRRGVIILRCKDRDGRSLSIEANPGFLKGAIREHRALRKQDNNRQKTRGLYVTRHSRDE